MTDHRSSSIRSTLLLMAPPPFKVVGPVRAPLTLQETADTLSLSPSDVRATLAAVDAIWHELPASPAAKPRATRAKSTPARKSPKPAARRGTMKKSAKAVRRTKVAKRAKRR